MTNLRNCAKAIIIRKNSILAIRYSDAGGVFYALPGGGQFHGETLAETLVRECQEELGITVVNPNLRFIREYIGLQGESSWRDAEIHQVEFMFECHLASGVEPREGQHGDQTQVGFNWLPVDSISHYRFYPKHLIRYLDQPLPNRVEYWGSVD